MIIEIQTYTVTDKIEWTGNGNSYELNLVKVVLLFLYIIYFYGK